MEEDLGKAIVVLRDVREKSKDALSHIQALIKKAEEGEFNTSKVCVSSLSHCIPNRLSQTIYLKSPISILGTSGFEIYIFLEKNG